jgi:triphosphoribosyl-dephospho-CoA synthetase
MTAQPWWRSILPRSSKSPCSAGHAGWTQACIESVQKELAKVEVMAAAHRADFEREREAERRMAELLKTTAYAMAARESMARLEGELLAMRSQPWWRRLAG